MNFDSNNLYGWAMIQYLAHGGFKWITKEEINKFNLDLVKENSLVGYILEVDLECASSLHNLHNDYPLVPEKLKVNNDMLSKYSSSIANNYGIKVGEVNKLIPNLGNEKNYVVHYRNLQLYISLGMIVTKVKKFLNLSNLIG